MCEQQLAGRLQGCTGSRSMRKAGQVQACQTSPRRQQHSQSKDENGKNWRSCSFPAVRPIPAAGLWPAVYYCTFYGLCHYIVEQAPRTSAARRSLATTSARLHLHDLYFLASAMPISSGVRSGAAVHAPYQTSVGIATAADRRRGRGDAGQAAGLTIVTSSQVRGMQGTIHQPTTHMHKSGRTVGEQVPTLESYVRACSPGPRAPELPLHARPPLPP